MRVPVLAAAVVVASCATDPEVRPQYVLSVDTDLPASGTPGANRLAVVDTLRVDVYSPEGARLLSSRDFVVSDPSAWPLTIGVAGAARVRLRAYRARSATPSKLDPDPAISVDRLVDLAPPRGGVARTQVVLRGDCIGHPADVSAGSSCIGMAMLRGPAWAGLGAEGSASIVASWAGARGRPCAASPPRTEVACVPGGYDIVGQSELLGVVLPMLEPTPLRPVLVRAVYMDVTEYTVGRFRQQLARPWLPRSPMPATARAGSTSLEYCTYRGPDDPGADVLPLNCVDAQLAAELCALDGGELPSEAEWEHAARGGDGRTFPWGAEAPRCCTVSASRDPSVDGGARCTGGSIVEPVGSHRGSASCLGDATVQGILDLGGGLSELTRDRFASAAEAWPQGLARDPVCSEPVRGIVVKGGDFSSGAEFARPAYRRAVDESSRSSLAGFRCVYRGEAP